VVKGLVMWKDCVVIPEDDDDLVKEVLSDAHNNAFAGHVGITKMVEHLHEKSIHVKNARTHAKRFINSCGICQKMKARQLVRMMMKNTTVSYPFDTVAVDTVGPIMPSKAKSRYLVVMVDCFTRWTEIVPTKRATAKAAADALISGIFGRFGLPRCIRSDRGTQYVNGMISEWYKKLGVTPHKVLPYHPQANGIVERTNQEVIRHMRIAAMRIGDNEEWEQLIPLAQYVINTTKNRMTGKTPYEALFGDFRKPARGTLLDWKDEVEEATLTDDVTPGEEMCEYVT
ncbi:hypothetical protein ADUPG1_001546, partial [Aduncisulcus paluster]